MNTNANEIPQSHIGNINKSRHALLIKGVQQTKNSPISPRESTCLSWAAVGKTADEIADILKISRHTVHFHTKNAIKKLDAHNKTHAVSKAIVMGYIPISRKIV